MSDLPTREYKWYAGIDPGFTGAIAWIEANGDQVCVVDMPITGIGRTRELDLGVLREKIDVLETYQAYQDCVVGLEWPTTRPGEGAERSERFGRGKGILEAFLYCSDLAYHKIPPNLWKGRLGLPGKQYPGANQQAAALFDTHYPNYSFAIRGPRGGILSGRIDALLIAHFLRTRSLGGMQSIVDRFGKDSDEAMAFVLSGGRRKTRC